MNNLSKWLGTALLFSVLATGGGMLYEVAAEMSDSAPRYSEVKITQDTTTRIWTGIAEPTSALLDASVEGWNGGTLLTGEAILRFDFASKVAKTGYTIRVNFADGTFLDITQ